MVSKSVPSPTVTPFVSLYAATRKKRLPYGNGVGDQDTKLLLEIFSNAISLPVSIPYQHTTHTTHAPPRNKYLKNMGTGEQSFVLPCPFQGEGPFTSKPIALTSQNQSCPQNRAPIFLKSCKSTFEKTRVPASGDC